MLRDQEGVVEALVDLFQMLPTDDVGPGTDSWRDTAVYDLKEFGRTDEVKRTLRQIERILVAANEMLYMVVQGSTAELVWRIFLRDSIERIREALAMLEEAGKE